jgi:very-short-patch-repair endonuclease
MTYNKEMFDSLFKGASPQHFEMARALKHDMTKAEKLLWEQLRDRKFDGLKFRRQHPIDRYILDFYCSKMKIAIEVDGGVHNTIEQKEYDETRTIRLNELGIQVLRIKNEEIEGSIITALEKVRKQINN